MNIDVIEVPADLEVIGSSASETTEPLAQPDQSAPSTGTEQTAENEASAETEATEPTEPTEQETEGQPKKQPWFVDRIAKQREQIAERDRQLQEQAARLAALERQQTDTPDPNNPQQQKPPTPAELQQMVRQEAARIAEAQAMQARLASFQTAGAKEFSDFDDRCNVVASLGAAENPAFMQVITSIDDGHKVVAQLAADPQKTVEILALPPLAMAVAIAKLSGATPKPPPVSKAPSPVKPIGGTSKADKDPARMTDAEWYAEFGNK